MSKINIVMPLAGLGSRFQGYELPKPLLKINNIPLYIIASRCLPHKNNRIFIAREEHIKQFELDLITKQYYPTAEILSTPIITAGQTTTVLLAKSNINNLNPLFVINCDHYIEFDWEAFLERIEISDYDGGILSFPTFEEEPKYSYVKVDNYEITEIAEKRKISNRMAVGVFFFTHGSDFVQYAEKAISDNIRINNEFYLSSVFDLMLQDGKRLLNWTANCFYSTGTPEAYKIAKEVLNDD